MSPARITAFIAFALIMVFVWGSCLFRYDLRVIANQQGYALAYRLDRWTGNLWLLDNDRWYPVIEGDPADFQQSFQSNESNS